MKDTIRGHPCNGSLHGLLRVIKNYNSPYQAKRFLVLLIRVHKNGENWAKNFLKMENKVAIVTINVLF